MKSYKINKHSRKHWPKLLLFFGIAGLLLAAIGFLGIKTLYERNLRPVNSSAQDDIIFVVETGMSAPEIGDKLEDQKLIRSSRAFDQYVRSNELGESFIAGTYRLRQSMDTPTIINTLTEGKVAVDLFTILPAKTLNEIKAAFVKEGYGDAEVQAAMNPALYEGHPALVDKPAGASLEGYIYPDSYQMLRGETKVETIIGQALDEMAEALTPEIRAGMAAQGLSVYEGITMASIVEQEIPAPPLSPKEDRRKAAQVFIKRNNIGMQLGSDVTAFYGAEINGAEASVSYDSPYNTRIYSGFPPSPIGNVTSDGLDAVAFPAETDYLYFVAGDGEYKNKTFFTRTLEEHEAAVNSYCNELCN